LKPGTLKADFLLLLTAAIWGFAFVAQRVGMEHIGPFLFNGIRFALGSLSLLPLIYLRMGNGKARSAPLVPIERNLKVAGSVLAGLVLFGGASLQQIGIVYTTAGKAGFITGLYVILVPIMGLFWKQRPGLGSWAGAIAATAGLYFLSVTEGLRLAPGDSLVLASAVFWAVHVLIIGWLSPRFNPLRIAAIQFATCWVKKYGPLRLMLITRSKLSSVASRRSNRFDGATPALLTNMSHRPNVLLASAIKLSRS